MAGIVQITQGGPRVFTPAVGQTILGGQVVEQRDDGRIQPAGAASGRVVGVALTDGMAPEDVNTTATLNSFGRPVLVAVPVPTHVAVAYDATEVYVTAAAPVLPGQRVIAAANGQVTSSGDPANDVQTVTISGSPTGGTFTLTFGGQTTAAIPYNATAAQVQAALAALSNVGAGNVSVTGSGPYVVTFIHALGGASQSAMTATGSFTGGSSPSIAVAHTTTGGTVVTVAADQIIGICTDENGIAANAIGRIRIAL